MRMTNKIMRNNSLYNINQNKILEDKLSNQMTNQSKIVRPSDDPVVAIRALRLRTNVTNINQYHDKNAEDAASWLSVTSDALNTVDEVLTDLYKQSADASNKYLTSDDLNIILTQMKSLTAEFYASGNVDFASRYVFSGFRTDTPITFTAADIEQMEKQPVSYKITENFSYDDISTINYTDFSALDELTDDLKDVDGTNASQNENDIKNYTLQRIRLSYDGTDDALPTIAIKDKTGQELAAADQPVLSTTVYASAEDAYQALANGTETADAVYIPSTGEIVFSDTYYGSLPEGCQFEITYDKSTWINGDINPVHYFKCIETTTVGQDPMGADINRVVSYNSEGGDQDIYYDVGYNQQIQVNTLAREVFTHDVQRDFDDFQHYHEQLKAVETKIAEIEKKMADYPTDSDEYKAYQLQLDAANKAYTYVRDALQTKFENQITKYQGYLDANNVATTNNATRGSRLDLITSRLADQKMTFKELQTNNEDIDVTQVAVELSSAELTYQAALMATSKIMQTNLMNYI